ncbi:MAG: type II toxin-antitoxin system VapC family toxin [Thermomicrobiales bacterium]
MSRILIDTDWIIDVLHGQVAAVEKLNELEPRGLAVSLISYGELYQGAYYARNRDEALAGLREFLVGKDLLPTTVSVMERFGIVRGQLTRQLRQQIGDMDVIIAATALTYDLTLMTRNLRDFQHIPDLGLYEPA